MTNLPDEQNPDRLWEVIAAKLTNLARPQDYLATLDEYLGFLGAQAGTTKGVRAFCSASEKHAAAYDVWIRQKPGQRPRLRRQGADERALLKSEKGIGRDGLQFALANASVRKRLSILRHLYACAQATGIVQRNPFFFVKLPAENTGRKRPTEMIDYRSVPKMLEAPDVSTQAGLRDRAIIAAAFGGGIRRGEFRKIRLADFRRTGNGAYYLHLRATKSRKDYDQVIPDWAGKLVAAWVKERRKRGAQPDDFLFCGLGARSEKHRKTPIGDKSIYRAFTRAARAAGLNVWATTHSARATYITKLYDDGVPDHEVQEAARHASGETTRRYKKSKKVMERAAGRKVKYG